MTRSQRMCRIRQYNKKAMQGCRGDGRGARWVTKDQQDWFGTGHGRRGKYVLYSNEVKT